MTPLSFLHLILWELRRLTRQTGTWLILLSLLVAGLMSLHTGRSVWASQLAEISDIPSLSAAQTERLSVRYREGGEAGLWAYHHAFPTWQTPHSLAALSFGVRDVVPMVTWVRLLGLEPQLYNAPIVNPRIQTLGSLDLSLVYAILAPLALLLLSHDSLSRDSSRGTLGVVCIQAGGLRRVLAARLAAALGLTFSCMLILFLTAIAWPGLQIQADNHAFLWFGYSAVHLFFWTLLAACVASRACSQAASLGAAFGCWIVFTVLLPSLLNLTLSTLVPVPEGLELTIRQRNAMHSTWDQPRRPNFDRFLETQKDWPHARQIPEEFTWTWYYAMHELADHSVSALAHAYVQRLRVRRLWTERIAWLIPPVLLQLQLSSLAATDLESHLVHLERVRLFHQELKQHFFPLFTEKPVILPAETQRFPHFRQAQPATSEPPTLAPLILLALGLLGLIRPNRAHCL